MKFDRRLSNVKRKRTSGYLARKRTKSGRRILRRRHKRGKPLTNV